MEFYFHISQYVFHTKYIALAAEWKVYHITNTLTALNVFDDVIQNKNTKTSFRRIE